MNQKKDSPGVYLPPPLIYVIIFLASIFIQKKFQIDNSLFRTQLIKIPGGILLFCALFFLSTSLAKFFKTKNTLIPFKPASSLQTKGVYSISRNPMYLGLALVYLGITCFIGNWWNIILFPFLILTVQELIIRKEEHYLERAFKDEFLEYKKRVRRWI
jgi:protein-S-isoprenylcysteine O-methyltransferase Ste14